MLSLISFHNKNKLLKLSHKNSVEILLQLKNKYKTDEFSKNFSEVWKMLKENNCLSTISENPINYLDFIENSLIINDEKKKLKKKMFLFKLNQNEGYSEIFKKNKSQEEFGNIIEKFIMIFLQEKKFKENFIEEEKRVIKLKKKLKLRRFTEGYMPSEKNNFLKIEIDKNYSYSVLSNNGFSCEYRLIGLKNTPNFDLSVKNIPTKIEAGIKDFKKPVLNLKFQIFDNMSNYSSFSTLNSNNSLIKGKKTKFFPGENENEKETEEEQEEEIENFDVRQNSDEFFSEESECEERVRSNSGRKKKTFAISDLTGFYFSKMKCKFELGIKSKIYVIHEVGFLKKKTEIVNSLLIICRKKIYFLENYGLSAHNFIREIDENYIGKDIIDWIYPNNNFTVIYNIFFL